MARRLGRAQRDPTTVVGSRLRLDPNLQRSAPGFTRHHLYIGMDLQIRDFGVSRSMAKTDDNMTLVRLRKEAQLTLPAAVRRALNVEEGDYLEAEIVHDGVLLKPVTISHRKAAWKSVMKAAATVKDTKPKAKRNSSAD